jgi:hypothetical protein
MRLCDATCALAAALVDTEGETVDYAGVVDPYEVRVSAAEWSLVLRVVARCESAPWQGTRQLMVRGARRSFAVVRVSSEYAIVVQLLPRCFRVSPRALAEARREIVQEAGLDPTEEVPHGEEQWVRLDVMTRPGTRTPTALWWGGEWRALEVLGRYASEQLGRGETAYRARLPPGIELTLVREPLGLWYADQILGVDFRASTRPERSDRPSQKQPAEQGLPSRWK